MRAGNSETAEFPRKTGWFSRMMSPFRVRIAVALAVMAMSVAVFCAGTTGTAAASGNSPGITSKQITIGLVTSITGAAAANFNGAIQGAQARFDLQNAEGGVFGRKFKLLTGDDQTSYSGATSAVADLVQEQNVFGLIFISDLTSGGAYKLPQQLGVPVVGFPTDGNEWALQPNTNMVSTEGDIGPTPVANTSVPKLAKLLGVKNMAVLAIDDEPPSDIAAQEFVKAARAVGLKVGYENYTLPLGSVNVTATVLEMKHAGVDGFDSFMLDNTNFALMETAKQAGLTLKAPIQAVGYGQDVLNSPSALQAAQGGVFLVSQVPVAAKTPATRVEQAAFAKYEHFSGIPNLNWTEGWISADLYIKGLQKAGKNVNRASFLRAERSIKGYTANGLLPTPLDLSLKDFGKGPSLLSSCSYFVKLEGKKFVTLNNGKPVCGTNVK
jgi:branched-chain amino acid transport system substrate-binding protein